MYTENTFTRLLLSFMKLTNFSLSHFIDYLEGAA